MWVIIRLISTNRFSIPIEVSAFKSLEGISYLIKSIIPPPCCILSSLYGGVNPSRINQLEGNEASNFVSDINKTSMLFPITSCNISNLFLKEFKLICANINLFGFLSLISCKSLKLCVKELGLSELPLSTTFGQDLLLFGRNHSQKILMKTTGYLS